MKSMLATNIIISKSGNTLETIANSNLLINGSKNIFIGGGNSDDDNSGAGKSNTT